MTGLEGKEAAEFGEADGLEWVSWYDKVWCSTIEKEWVPFVLETEVWKDTDGEDEGKDEMEEEEPIWVLSWVLDLDAPFIDNVERDCVEA